MNLHRAALRLSLSLAVSLSPWGHALAAQGELLEIDWTPEGSFAREARVEPKQFLEVCGKLPAGVAVQWRFESRRPMDFNIHFHEGKDVRYPARKSAVTKAGDTFITPRDQDYCWMWTNKSGAKAEISFSLQKK